MIKDSPDPPYYGWLMLAGIAVSVVIWTRLAKRDGRLLLIYLGALSGAFIGAKLGYILVEGWADLHAPDSWRRLAAGKTILGALLGGYAGVEAAKKWVGWSEPTGDLFALVAPLGIVLGRIGCLLHGCCLGVVCYKAEWWTLADRSGVPRWPAVPVEIGFNLAAIGIFGLVRLAGRLPGQHFHLYLIGYGIFRFAHEFWRATPRIIGPLSGYQGLALMVIGLCVWGLIRRQRAQSVTH
jgi:phosphatidylglycerol:prolipoprotein diacylglycerol transferase